MGYLETGFKTLTETGSPDITPAAGSYRGFHAYITNDDGPTVEAAQYFDKLGSMSGGQGRLAVGDVIMAQLDIDGVPIVRHYIVTATTPHVTITHGSAGSGTGLTVLPFFTNLADITATDIFAGYVPGFPFRIEALDFVTNKPATTAAKLATLQPKISGTLITGGAVALTSANCTPQGNKVAGSAVTALNVGAATDSIAINASTVTAFVEGNGWILLKLRNLDG